MQGNSWRWHARRPRRCVTEAKVLPVSRRRATAARPHKPQVATEPATRPLRIAVPSLEDEFWTVGPIHMKGLLSAVRATYSEQVGLFSFGSATTDTSYG